MMLKELLAIFNKDSKLDEAFRLSYEMLDITRDMFLKAKRSLRETETSELDRSVYKQDKKINKFEREVRREVLQHLAVAGQEGLASGLTLVSIISDIERLGDYTKNIVELAENHPNRLHAGHNEDNLRRVESSVEEAFGRVRAVLETSDEEAALAFIEDYIWLNPLCDKRVTEYISEVDDSVSPGDAVALALYFRYLKRIHSHLRNVATSVYRPFHKIGHISKKVKRKGKIEEPSTDQTD
jgi:phosphate uptake regulator